MKNHKSGSSGVWLFIAIVFIILFTIAAVIWAKIFLVTSGIDSQQVDTYKNALDKANDLRQKIEERKIDVPQ
ncbi:hypothetical protein HY357_02565 [Candidatus Roizmanbacteria bacterium]|nr:hypothetical protein [Candidatus Roizmanbacteria bacterium]